MQDGWIKRAKVLMAERRITQLDLVPVLGKTTRGAVGHYLTGRTSPSIQQLQDLASYFDVSLNFLLYGDDQGAGVNIHKLTQCIKAVTSAAKDLEIDISDDQLAHVAAYLYSDIKSNEEVSAKKAQHLVNMMVLT